MSTDTNATVEETGVEPNGPLIAPVEPDLKSERVQVETAEPVVEAG